MNLDHDSGEMSGEVIAGEFAGKALNNMNLNQCLELHQYCAHSDQQSKELLEAYLERRFGEGWQDHQQSTGQGETGSGNMSRTEAYEVLGLAPEATKEDIVAAHRKLMQKLHPDRGGSTYLATKLNQAKDSLLG
ncbi:MAG: DnaJ domain-containing protein [Pseudomonadales bacterium]|nr:DnaJ domain-containing protein [Pseudomonadales bacterium]